MYIAEPDRRSIQADVPPDRLEKHDLIRARTAQRHALAIYPGVIGEVLAAEISAYADFGWRVCTDARIPRLVDHLMTQPLP